METPIIRTISGIRGLVDKTLDAVEAYKTVVAFYDVYLSRHLAKDKPNQIIIGRDPKAYGAVLAQGALAAIRDLNTTHDTNLKPVWLGVTSSPLLEWAVLRMQAVGGINFTASHNPIEWNGIKLVAGPEAHATLLNAEQMKKLNVQLSLFDQELTGDDRKKLTARIKNIRLPNVRKSVTDQYNRDVIRQISQVADDCAAKKGYGASLINKIRSANLRVVVDGCSKDGGDLVTGFLKTIGIRSVKQINNGTIENSGRRLEPAPPYLNNLRKAIKDYKADIGFAVDPDQDRLVALPLKTEEHSPLLAARFLFELQKGTRKKTIRHACVNLSTTGAWEEVAESCGIQMIRTKIGELNVAEGMLRKKAILGAEGNGGVLLAPVNYGRNSTVAVLLLLMYLVHTGKSLAALERQLPVYELVKDKQACANPKQALTKVRRHYKDNSTVDKIDNQDGVKVVFKDRSWAQVRASNTEPIIRIFAEARADKSRKFALDKAKKLVKRVQALVTEDEVPKKPAARPGRRTRRPVKKEMKGC